MSVDIIVPPLGESVTEATIAKWFKQPGDYVEADEVLVELETDKVTLEVNAPSAGVLGDHVAKEDDNVEVGAVLGSIDESKAGQSAPKKAEASQETPKESAPKASNEQILSPAAAKIAKENNLSNIAGTGKDGRVTKSDAMSAASAPKASVKSEERVKMTKLRQRIAQRLKESQNTAAILTTFNEVDMTNIMALRSQYKESFEKKHGVKLGFMSFFLKAAVNALKEIPTVNAQIEGDEIIYKNYYDIGVAVGTPQGLVVPVVRDVDNQSFAEVEGNIVELGKKARDGKLSMEEMTGGTFTVTNGGVYGSLMSTPIINPPQTGILGMHKIQQRPMAVDGKVEIRPMMYIALSYDHRLIDGKDSVTFLVRVKEAIENPERLLLDM